MIRILVVDDQNLVREGIKILLEQSKEIQVVGEAKDGREALQNIEMLQPDIVLLDIEMPDISGLLVAKKIRARYPKVKIIMLSTHEDSSYMQKATSCGAKGYLLKSVSSQELEWSIKLVSQGYSAIKSELLEQQLSQPEKSDSDNKQSQSISLPSQNYLQRKNTQDNLQTPKQKTASASSNSVNTLPSTNGANSNGKIETLLARNQIGLKSSNDHQNKRKKKNNQLLHGVSLLRLKRTVASFEFKLLAFIILFSLGFLVFIGLSAS